MNEKPVDLGVFMGVMSLHFSKLAINIITFLNAVLLAGTQQLILLVSASEHVDIAESACLEIHTHMRVSLLPHAG